MKSDILIKGLTFVAGSVIGSTITYLLTYKKCEKESNEKVNSIREYYEDLVKDLENQTASKSDDTKDNEKVAEPVGKNEPERDILSEIRGRVKERVKEKKEEEDVRGPQIVAPEETWERDYPTLSLIYYEGDKVLADESYKEIINVSDLVPEDFADHFGEFEEDSVFVRNDNLQVYYEILKDCGSFSEIDG